MIFINIIVDNINISYIEKGTGQPIILLHGWGQTKETFNDLINSLCEEYKVIAIDLPGFGDTEIGVPLDLFSVAELIYHFVEQMNIKKPIMIGHSYGARIVSIYGSKYNVSKIVIISGAGIKQKISIINRLKIRIYKFFKKRNIILKLGSKDYINSDNVKRSMLVNAINTDLSKELTTISVPTLLIYGKNDKVTPLDLGYKMKNKIKYSELIEVEDCGHFPYIEKPTIFRLILNSFLVSDN